MAPSTTTCRPTAIHNHDNRHGTLCVGCAHVLEMVHVNPVVTDTHGYETIMGVQMVPWDQTWDDFERSNQGH